MSRSRLLFGLMLIVLGSAFLLDQMGLIAADAIIRQWWPLVIIAAGVAMLIAAPRNVGGGVIAGGIGVVLLLWTLEVIDSLGLIWPILLIAFGVWLLTRRPSDAPRASIDDGDVTVVLGDRKAKVRPGPLGIEAITVVLADADLDLRETSIAGVANLKIVCVLGDVDLMVPDNWNVVVNGPEVLGDVKVRNTSAATGGPTLRVEMVAVLGNVEIRS